MQKEQVVMQFTFIYLIMFRENQHQCKLTCRYELDIGPGKTDRDVEFNSTMDL